MNSCRVSKGSNSDEASMVIMSVGEQKIKDFNKTTTRTGNRYNLERRGQTGDREIYGLRGVNDQTPIISIVMAR